MPSTMRRSRTRAIKRYERDLFAFDLDSEGFDVIEVFEFESTPNTCFHADTTGGRWA